MLDIRGDLCCTLYPENLRHAINRMILFLSEAVLGAHGYMFTSINLWTDSMLFYCCVFYPLNAISEARSTAQHLSHGRKYQHLYIECMICRPGWFFGESYMNMCRDRGIPPPSRLKNTLQQCHIQQTPGASTTQPYSQRGRS